MRTNACSHCICSICEDKGCPECALCKGRYKTDSCSEAFITPRKRKKKTKDRRLTMEQSRDNGQSLQERRRL